MDKHETDEIVDDLQEKAPEGQELEVEAIVWKEEPFNPDQHSGTDVLARAFGAPARPLTSLQARRHLEELERQVEHLKMVGNNRLRKTTAMVDQLSEFALRLDHSQELNDDLRLRNRLLLVGIVALLFGMVLLTVILAVIIVNGGA